MPFTCPYTTEEDIRALDFFACDEILRKNEIDYQNLETDSEMQDLILKHLSTADSEKEDECHIWVIRGKQNCSVCKYRKL